MRRTLILILFLALIFLPGANQALAQEARPEIDTIGSRDLLVSVSPDTGCYRILFDETHGTANDQDVGDYTIAGGFSELADFLRGNGHIVESLQDPAPFDLPTLQRYDVLVLVLPQEFYTAAEKAIISQFVNQGGRLVTIGEYGGFAGTSRDILNGVHDYLGDGLTHNNDSVSDPTDNKDGLTNWPLIHTFSSSPVNSGVSMVAEKQGSSLLVAGPANGTAFGDDDTTAQIITQAGSTTDGNGVSSLLSRQPQYYRPPPSGLPRAAW